MKDEIRFACPLCRGKLESVAPDRLRCPVDKETYWCIEGIWRFLPAERLAFFAPFVEDYETIRLAEQRGSDDPAYYQALPFEDATGRHASAWRIRAHSYQTFLRYVLEPVERHQQRPLTILDLGAGNGWLSHRLGVRGHRLAAVDLMINAFDGLGTHPFYPISFDSLQAEFDRLPMSDHAADLIIYNASFHYSTDYALTLAEARRVLHHEGKVVVMDTPLYHDGESGRRMVAERKAQFNREYGRPSDRLASEDYLTYTRLDQLARTAGLTWRMVWPIPVWQRRVRQWRSRLAGHREPAQFPVVVGWWGK